MKNMLKAVALVLFAIGALIVFLAGKIEKKYQLRHKENVKDCEGFDEKETADLKRQKAVIRIKLYGLAVLLPGLIGILVLFG